MFGVLDELETAIDKAGADERPLDVERMCRLAERVEFLKLRAIAEYDRSEDWRLEQYVSTASALRHKCRMSHGAATRSVNLARKLGSLPETAAAFGAGEISAQHAAVIAAAATPERAGLLERMEAAFVDAARVATPEQLRNVVRRITDADDGDGGGASDEREHRLNKVTLAEVGDRGILNGSLDAELAKLADAAFEAEMAVLKRPGDTRLLPERRAEAFEAMCRRSLDALDDGTRRRRGQPHMLFVQDVAVLEADHPDLVSDLRAEASRFGRLSQSTLDRLACDCKFARVLTDGPSQILDVGRTTRNVSTAQWNALVARDRHCQWPGCDRPPSVCEAHHIWYWSLDGPTDLANLKLLCWHHHRQTHSNDPPRKT